MIKVLTGRCEPSTVMVRVKGKVRQENLRVETEMASPWLYAPAHSTVLSQQGRFLPQIAGGAASGSNERGKVFPPGSLCCLCFPVVKVQTSTLQSFSSRYESQIPCFKACVTFYLSLHTTWSLCVLEARDGGQGKETVKDIREDTKALCVVYPYNHDSHTFAVPLCFAGWEEKWWHYSY